MSADLRKRGNGVKTGLCRLSDNVEIDNSDIDHAEGDEDGAANEEGSSHFGSRREEWCAIAMVAIDVP